MDLQIPLDKHIIGAHTEKFSREIKGDLLTQFDIDNYHVIHYLDGTKKMTLSLVK